MATVNGIAKRNVAATTTASKAHEVSLHEPV